MKTASKFFNVGVFLAHDIATIVKKLHINSIICRYNSISFLLQKLKINDILYLFYDVAKHNQIHMFQCSVNLRTTLILSIVHSKNKKFTKRRKPSKIILVKTKQRSTQTQHYSFWRILPRSTSMHICFLASHGF